MLNSFVDNNNIKLHGRYVVYEQLEGNNYYNVFKDNNFKLYNPIILRKQILSLLELKGLKSNDNVVVKKDVVDTEKQQVQQLVTVKGSI